MALSKLDNIFVYSACNTLCVCSDDGGQQIRRCPSDTLAEFLSNCNRYNWVFDLERGSIFDGIKKIINEYRKVIIVWPSTTFKRKYELYLRLRFAGSIKNDKELSTEEKNSFSKLAYFYEQFQYNRLKDDGNFVIHLTFERNALPLDIAKWFSPVLVQIDENGQIADIEKLCTEIEDSTLRIQDMSPCGNIAYGLVWSFNGQYLRKVLEPFDEQERAAAQTVWDKFEENFRGLQKPENHRLARTRLIIVATSGIYEDSLQSCLGKSSCNWELKKDVGGNKGRSYKCTAYEIEDTRNQIVHHVQVEYCTPVRAMMKMRECKYGGMSEYWLENQIAIFYDNLVNRCDKEGEFEWIRIMKFDDKEITNDDERRTQLKREVLKVLNEN